MSLEQASRVIATLLLCDQGEVAERLRAAMAVMAVKGCEGLSGSLFTRARMAIDMEDPSQPYTPFTALAADDWLREQQTRAFEVALECNLKVEAYLQSIGPLPGEEPLDECLALQPAIPTDPGVHLGCAG